MLIVALALLGGAIVAIIFFILNIQNQGETLRTYITALGERSAQEASYARIAKLVQETEVDRKELAGAFFTDDGEAVSLLTNIESAAGAANLEIDTTGLEQKENKEDKTQQLFIRLSYSGTKEQVFAFTQYLETIPYHSWLEQLVLERKNSGQAHIWSGETTLVVTIKSS